MSEKTVAQEMVSELRKISEALTALQKAGLPRSIVLAYLQKRTKLPQKDILLVLDGLRELNSEMVGTN